MVLLTNDSSTSKPSLPEEVGRFLLIYGSQTGQAKAIAEEISETAPTHGLHADIHCISLTEKRFWLEREQLAVIITSTTGDGEAPDTAQKFWRRLKKKTNHSNQLANLTYAILGLGDSNYSNFCICGKMFDQRLQELGAKHFYESGWADDAVGLELVVEPWMERLWPALKEALQLPPGGSTVSNHHEKEVLHEPSKSRTVDKSVTSKDSTDLSKAIHPPECSPPIIVDGTVNGDVVKQVDKARQIPRDVKQLDTIAGNGSREILNETSNVSLNRLKNSSDSNPGPSGDHTAVVLLTEMGRSSPEVASIGDTKPMNRAPPGVEICSEVLAGPGETPRGGDEVDGQEVSEETGEESLRNSLPPLSESALKLPVLPAAFLKITFHPNETVDLDSSELHNGCSMPSGMSEVSQVPVIAVQQMTSEDAVKRALRLELDISECSWDWLAGDSFGIVCPNSADDVDALLARLDMSDMADVVHKLEVLPDTKKRNPSVPGHIPDQSTLRHTLQHCCDLRSPPKKAFIRALVEHTVSSEQHRRLQELCSKQGGDHYTRFVRESNVSILDVLAAFPSCSPPITTILEQLPRLQPRPYSAASSPRLNKGHLQFVFNVVEIPCGSGRSQNRKGVCTGYLDEVTKGHQRLREVTRGHQPAGGASVEACLATLTLQPYPKISVYLRNNHHFRPPSSLSVPIVMIGPGTGVAPFVGFLQHRQAQLIEAGDSTTVGESWLLYGCRHRLRDFLFRAELEEFRDTGVLSKLVVAFSRELGEGDSPRYVQDNVRRHGERLAAMIHDEAAVVYVCGDARGMARGVSEAFSAVLQEHQGLSSEDAAGYLMQMRLHRRYLEDIWT